MSGLSDRVTNVDKLKAEIRRLEQELQQERREKGALLAELARLQSWTEKIVGPAFGGLHDVVSDLRGAVERMSSRMSEQLDQLNSSLSDVEGAVNTLTQTVSNETQQVLAELERLRNQNPSIDLAPVIARVQGLRTAVDEANTNIGNIIADAQPEPPQPGRGRR